MVKVLGICSKYPKLKKYILWALCLIEDMEQIFSDVKFSDQFKPGYDVYIVDDLIAPLPNALVIHMKSKILLFSNSRHCK